MQIALRLAARGLGTVAPNPAVGAVIVSHATGVPRIIGTGTTQPGGRPHAETQAIAQAREIAPDLVYGATLYVTLEPCAHHGHTPPCADAVVEAGFGRVVVACSDPDARVNGQGIARLKQAGIEVVEGVLGREAEALNQGFLTVQREGRPMVTLKCATTLDGRIATHSGESQWITGEEARAAGHGLRANHDAIMVGAMTAQMDDPDLTCRLPGLESRSPVRIVADSRAQLSLTSRLVRGMDKAPVWVLVSPQADAGRKKALADLGVAVIEVEAGPDGLINQCAALQELAERGTTRLLVEGGARLAATLIGHNLVDRLELFQSGLVIGGDGLAAIGGLGLDKLGEAPRFRLAGSAPLGPDLSLSYVNIGI